MGQARQTPSSPLRQWQSTSVRQVIVYQTYDNTPQLHFVNTTITSHHRVTLIDDATGEFAHAFRRWNWRPEIVGKWGLLVVAWLNRIYFITRENNTFFVWRWGILNNGGKWFKTRVRNALSTHNWHHELMKLCSRKIHHIQGWQFSEWSTWHLLLGMQEVLLSK